MTFVTGISATKVLHFDENHSIYLQFPTFVEGHEEKVRLLVVDEHKAVRTALETRLRSSNAIEVVASAHNVAAGQSCLRSGSPDVVLYGLKSSNSFGLGPTLNAVARLSGEGIHVIVLASYADDVQRELLLHAGACRYLLKDINSSQLIAAIVDVASGATV